MEINARDSQLTFIQLGRIDYSENGVGKSDYHMAKKKKRAGVISHSVLKSQHVVGKPLHIRPETLSLLAQMQKALLLTAVLLVTLKTRVTRPQGSK